VYTRKGRNKDKKYGRKNVNRRYEGKAKKFTFQKIKKEG
jgi:hypothetical protein